VITVTRQRPVRHPAPEQPGNVPEVPAGVNGHAEKAVEIFSGDVAAGAVPGVPRLRKEMHLGQTRAQRRCGSTSPGSPTGTRGGDGHDPLHRSAGVSVRAADDPSQPSAAQTSRPDQENGPEVPGCPHPVPRATVQMEKERDAKAAPTDHGSGDKATTSISA